MTWLRVCSQSTTRVQVMPDVPTMRENQPNWVYWATWFDFESADGGNPDSSYERIYADPSVLTRDEVAVPTCPQVSPTSCLYPGKS